MPKPITEEGIQEVAEALIGTSSDLDHVLQEVFEDPNMTMEDVPGDMLAALDDQTMLCGTCGWWVDTSEIDDDGNCAQCAEENS